MATICFVVKVLYSFINFMCSVPVAIEHWLCDALYVLPTIAYLVSMVRSRCVIINGETTYSQSSFAKQSKQHYIVY